MIDSEIGFTSDVIKDPKRFVGRTKLIENCIKGINSSHGLIAIIIALDEIQNGKPCFRKVQRSMSSLSD